MRVLHKHFGRPAGLLLSHLIGRHEMRWLLESLRRMYCAFRGHDTILCFHHDRLSLRCLSCSYTTAGWTLQPDSFNGSSASHERLTAAPNDSGHSRETAPPPRGVAFAQRNARRDRDGRGSTAKRPPRAMRWAS